MQFKLMRVFYKKLLASFLLFFSFLGILAYITTTISFNHCPPTISEYVQEQINDVSRRSEYVQEQINDVSRRKALHSRNIETGTCLCSSAYSKLFPEDAVQSAIDSRLNWTKALPFTIESEHLKHSTSQPEQEYPYSHQRFDILGPIVPQCNFMESYGTGDDEKRACGLKGLLQQVSNCTIISLGSNNQWGFEESIFNAIPNCIIHTFDCTVGPNVEPPAEIANRTKLHRICIGSEDSNIEARSFMSWKSVMKLIGASVPPLYLKMDIEGYEYQVLRNIVDDGFLMPMQIAFELHYTPFMKDLPWYGRRKSSGEIASFMEYLHYQGGYFLLDRHDNPGCPGCTELLVTRLPCPIC
jgi:hypothetical protein